MWLITLAAVMAFFVGLAGEAFSRGLYDFLRDFQTAFVGVAAFSLAYWAAGPVFGQMKETRRQASVLTYEMLRQAYAALAEERDALAAGILETATATLFEEILEEAPVDSLEMLDYWSTDFKTNAEVLRNRARSFEKFKLQPSGLQSIRNGRAMVRATLTLLCSVQEQAHKQISELSEQHRTRRRSDWAETKKELELIEVKRDADRVETFIRKLSEHITDEMKRISALMDESYAQISMK
jgi:hypothetical protein